MILSFAGYREALEEQKQKEDKITVMEQQLSSMQSQMQSLMSTFANMQEQPQVDSMAKTLYRSGLIKAADNNNNDNNEELLIKAAGRAAYHATRTKSALTREAKAKAKRRR